MSKTLIRWDSNWADEMDISGFVIIQTTEATEFKERLSNLKSSFEICVGTNEEIEYEGGEALLDDLTFITLTDSEYDTVENVLGTEFGHTEFFQDWWDNEEDDWEDEED